MAIGNGCKALNVLSLSDCYYLNDQSLVAIASGCSDLTQLEVNGCHNIHTAGIEAIGQLCRYSSMFLFLFPSFCSTGI